MVRWRVAVSLLLLAVVAGPIALPFAELAWQPGAWSAWHDIDRIAALAASTARLVGGVLLIDLPLGVLLAVLLYRSDLPGRTFLRGVIVVSLFVPLPLLTSAWQAALAGAGWLGPPNPGWPWATGLRTAIWVHAVAGLPWVVWLVGQGLCWVEPEIEEDARLATSRWQTLWRVTLPRATWSIVAAAAWVALLTAQEITVTDLTQVRTFAEEVYTQFVLPDPAGGATPSTAIARAVAMAFPGVVIAAFAVGMAVWRWESAAPPLGSAPDPRPLLELSRMRWPAFALSFATACVLIGVPVGSLVWKVGQQDQPDVWSAPVAAHYLRLAARAHAWLIAGSLLAAGIAGLMSAGLALLGCWLARDSRPVRAVLVVVVALCWATPGPIVGVGLKSMIERIVDLEARLAGHGPIRVLLYNGPSAVPVIWADVLRFFPCAVALVWTVVRLVPRSLTDAARLDGASPIAELRYGVWPSAAPAFGRAAVAVGVLALGELSASKLVATPGDRFVGETFAHTVWARMHYGVANNLAALCLVLLVVVIPPTALLWMFRKPGRGP